MLTNAILFLLQAILGLLTLAFLLRFYLQLTRAPFQNQAAQFIVAITNFAVKPLRRLIPSAFNFDLSTLILAFLTQAVLLLATLWLKAFPLLLAGATVWYLIAAVALLGVVTWSLSIFLYAVLLQAVLSWVNPHTPIAPILHHLSDPILRIIRKFIPPVSNFDLSPLVFVLAAQLLLTTVFAPLEIYLLASL